MRALVRCLPVAHAGAATRVLFWNVAELMNEPFAGDIILYHDPTLLLPGEAGKKNLQLAYDVVARLAWAPRKCAP